MVAARELSGIRFGRLTAIQPIGNRCGQILWDCVCDCGTSRQIMTSQLTCGKTKSCGCLRKEKAGKLNKKDLFGKKFGRLTVIAENKRSRCGDILWNCSCICGKTANVATRDLISGHTRSCGCLQKQHAKKHILKLNKKQRGKNHPCWRGGINRPYPLTWTPSFRTKIRKTFGYKCAICQKPGIGLDIHHIDENKENCKKNNLIVLCRKCHRRVHTGKLKLKDT